MLIFRALASGSSGNAFLLRTGKVTLLFDAGLPLSKLSKALASEEVRPESITAAFVSHEHGDHCTGAQLLAEKFGTEVWANSEVLLASGLAGLPTARMLDVGSPRCFGDVEVTTYPVSHDAVRPVGFLVSTANRCVMLATDLGTVTDEVAEAVQLADLVVIEANHDTEMLHSGRYPYHLRRRISGPTGHLSNAQTAALLSSRLEREDVDIWLAHLSRNNNTPTLAARTVSRSLKAAGMGSLSVNVVARDRPSLRWTGNPRPRQLALFP